MIYHVADNQEWENAKLTGYYEHPSLKKENFIHLCSPDQLKGVIDRYYKNQSPLTILHIDEHLLTSRLQYDYSASVMEEFPHVYGPINLDAISDISYR